MPVMHFVFAMRKKIQNDIWKILVLTSKPDCRSLTQSSEAEAYVADTQIVYEERVKNAKHLIGTGTSEKTLNYFNNKLLPVIHKHVVNPYQERLLARPLAL